MKLLNQIIDLYKSSSEHYVKFTVNDTGYEKPIIYLHLIIIILIKFERTTYYNFFTQKAKFSLS